MLVAFYQRLISIKRCLSGEELLMCMTLHPTELALIGSLFRFRCNSDTDSVSRNIGQGWPWLGYGWGSLREWNDGMD